ATVRKARLPREHIGSFDFAFRPATTEDRSAYPTLTHGVSCSFAPGAENPVFRGHCPEGPTASRTHRLIRFRLPARDHRRPERLPDAHSRCFLFVRARRRESGLPRPLSGRPDCLANTSAHSISPSGPRPPKTGAP